MIYLGPMKEYGINQRIIGIKELLRKKFSMNYEIHNIYEEEK
jgi:hypothetical protein